MGQTQARPRTERTADGPPSHWLCTVCCTSNEWHEPRCLGARCSLAYRVSGVPISSEDAEAVSSDKKRRLPSRQPPPTPPLRRRVNAPEPGCEPQAGQPTAAGRGIKKKRPPKPPKTMPLRNRINAGGASVGPSAAAASGPTKARAFVPLDVSEVSDESPRDFKAARATLTWARIQAWANTNQRKVVQKRDLVRMFDFTTKILTVSRRRDGEIVGCALLCQAAENALVADSLRSQANPSLPMVKTVRMGTHGPIRDAHIRTAFSRATADHPIDELVLICGERGCGRAIIDHLRGQQRILFASVVPGSADALTFYEKHFRSLPFERRDGELPYAAWLGD